MFHRGAKQSTERVKWSTKSLNSTGRSYRVYSRPESTKNSKLYQIDVKIFVPPLFRGR